MAVFETSRPLMAGRPNFNVVARAFFAVSDWNDRRLTRKALSQLTNRELDDIGLIRGDVDRM